MSRKDKKTSFLPRDPNFYKLIDLLDGRTSLAELNRPRFTSKDTGITYRVINHWSKNDILPDGVKTGKVWHKFTLIEMVWIKVATRLREFGFSLKKISEIKKQILWFTQNGECNNYSFFDYYVGKAWFGDEDVYVIVLANGLADIGLSSEIEIAKREVLQTKKDMLLISLKGILDEMDFNPVEAKMLSVVNNTDQVVLNVLMKNKGDINAKFKDGKLKEIEDHKVIIGDFNIRKTKEDIK